jgi:OPA family sugar phosphate sensor protein UhpC-like MFS transporter
MFALAAFLFVPAGYYWLDCFIVVLFGLSIGVLICFLGGLMAVDIAPAEAAGATAGVIGMASYAAAGLQDIVSGYLIEGRKIMVGDVAQYDFSAIRIFWLCAAGASLALLIYIYFHAKRHPQVSEN